MKSDDYYDEYDDESDRRWIKPVAVALAVVALGAGAFVLFKGDDNKQPQLGAATTATDNSVEAAATTSTGGTATDPTTGTTSAADDTDATDDTDTTDVADSGSSTASSASAASAASAASSAVTTAGTSEADASTTSLTVADVASEPAAPLPGTTTIPAGIDPALGYPTSPDGAPLPVVAIFDTATITLTGYVPSQAAKDRLAALALANSQTPAEVVDNMIINDKVPPNVGVRVIELNSPRFPEASAEILPAHAAQLDRVVTVMNAFPNIAVLVIGHADQRGTDANNFAISDARARAVVNYFIFLGISPTRLSSRAAGDTELLTVADDATSLALNRRTEFVIYGLLVE